MSNKTNASPVPFALLPNGRLVDISSFDSGVLTDGKCPGCGGVLVAKKGEKRAHHFGHYSISDCVNPLETCLHLAAKQVLIDAVADGRSFYAPAFGHSYSEKRKYPAIDSPLFAVECEKSVFLQDQHRRPDAVAEWALVCNLKIAKIMHAFDPVRGKPCRFRAGSRARTAKPFLCWF